MSNPGPAPRAGTGGHCPPTSAMCPPTSSYVSTVSRGIFNFLKHFKITWFPEHNKWMITGANSGAKGAYISPPTQLMNIHPKRMVVLSEIDKWAKSGHQVAYKLERLDCYYTVEVKKYGRTIVHALSACRQRRLRTIRAKL